MTQHSGESAHLVVTVHGIRTFGHWQERLEQEIRLRNPTTTVFNYKYGYFSILAFIFPPTRWLITRRFRKALRKAASERIWSRIDIVCHSFGTHLVGWGLLGIEPRNRPPLHTLILAGSVLKPGFPWKDLVGTSITRIVNECGIHDGILLLNQLMVLFTGMAGREGFNGMTGEAFRNRFFSFGHSGYFEKEGKPDNEFMVSRWIPLLLAEGPIEAFPDPRSPSPWRGLMTFIFNNSEPIKLILWVSPLVGLMIFINTQRTEAVAQRDLANLRLAEALIAQGRAEASVENVGDAEQRYREARGVLTNAARNPFAAELALWDLHRSNSPPLIRIQGPPGLFRIALSPDGKRVVTVGMDSAWLIDLQTGATLSELDKCGLTSISTDPLFSSQNLDNTVTGAPITFTRNTIFWGDTKGKLHACAASDGALLWQGAGHSKRVTAISQGADGLRVATGAKDGSIVMWDVPQRIPLHFIQAHRGQITALTISQDAREVLSTGIDGSMKLWEWSTGRLLAEFADKQLTGAAVAFLPAGEGYVSVGSKGAGYWSRSSRLKPIRFVASDELVAEGGRFVMSPNGQYLLSALRIPMMVAANSQQKYSLLRLWKLYHKSLSASEAMAEASRGRAFPNYAVRVKDAAFSTKGDLVVTALGNGIIEVWNLEEVLEPRDHLKLGAVQGKPSFSPDDRLVLSQVNLWEESSEGPRRVGAGIWDVAAGVRLKLFNDGSADVSSVAYSADGSTLLLGDREGSLRHLDATSGKSLAALKVHNGAVTSIDTSQVGDFALTSGEDGDVKLWDLRRHALARSFEDLGDPFQSATLSPNGRMVAASTEKGNVRVWNLAGEPTLARLLDQQSYSNLAFSPDSNRLAWGKHGKQIAWIDILTPRQVSTIDTQGKPTNWVDFVSDGSWLASVSPFRDLTLWDLDRRRMEYAFMEHHEGALPLAVAHNRMQVLSNGAYGQHLFWDFRHTHEYLESETTRTQAFVAVAKNPTDLIALRSVAIYYAFAGRCDWAVDLFDRAAATHSNIEASEDLARCYFLTGHRDKALKQFKSLKARNAVPTYYADLWIEFLSAR